MYEKSQCHELLLFVQTFMLQTQTSVAMYMYTGRPRPLPRETNNKQRMNYFTQTG